MNGEGCGLWPSNSGIRYLFGQGLNRSNRSGENRYRRGRIHLESGRLGKQNKKADVLFRLLRNSPEKGGSEDQLITTVLKESQCSQESLGKPYTGTITRPNDYAV